jgi:16S rRNA (adenine1518-N6/adenine1519-N6)-dimethyltransferase
MDDVPKSAFFPQPKVDSIIVSLAPKHPKPFTVKNEALFRKLVQSLFNQRNRKAKNAVLPFLKGICKKTAEEATKQASTLRFRDERIRELAPEDFGELLNALES